MQLIRIRTLDYDRVVVQGPKLKLLEILIKQLLIILILIIQILWTRLQQRKVKQYNLKFFHKLISIFEISKYEQEDKYDLKSIICHTSNKIKKNNYTLYDYIQLFFQLLLYNLDIFYIVYFLLKIIIF